MKPKLIFALGIVASTFLVSNIVHAHPLAIANHTGSILSFAVNDVCSEEIGTISEFEIKTIPEETLNRICSNYSIACEIKAFDGKNCKATTVGGLKYLSEHNIVVFASGSTDISISATENALFFEGPLKTKLKTK